MASITSLLGPGAQRRAARSVNAVAVGTWTAALIILFAAGATIPAFTSNLSFWFYLFQWIALATGLNLMAGFTGYLPFGYVAFFGVGAYVTAVVVQFHGGPIWLGLGCSGVAGILVALIFAPTLRLTGIFFSIVSFSLAVAIQNLISNLPASFAGGSSGIIFTATRDPSVYYYAMLATAAGAVGVATFIATSRMGMMLKAIRDDAVAASVVGIDVARVRLGAWIISAVIGSLCGAIEGLYTAILDPSTAFNVLITAKAIIYAAVGGLGTVMGPVIGAIGMTVIDELAWARFPATNLFILGAVIVGVVLYLPKGLIGTLLQKNPRLRKSLF